MYNLSEIWKGHLELDRTKGNQQKKFLGCRLTVKVCWLIEMTTSLESNNAEEKAFCYFVGIGVGVKEAKREYFENVIVAPHS